jgi:GAF domain-containing protein
MLEAIGDISRELLATGFTPHGVSTALAGVGRVLRVDRAYIFENSVNSAGELCCSQRYEWSAHDVVPQIDNPELQNLPYREAAPSWVQPLSNDKPVHGLTRQMDPQAAEILAAQGILSVLVCPITLQNSWWGFVGFDDCHSERQWESEEVLVLGLLARSLGGALRHSKMRQTLDTARLQLREVVRYCERDRATFPR